jgi:hypothetical protein
MKLFFYDEQFIPVALTMLGGVWFPVYVLTKLWRCSDWKFGCLAGGLGLAGGMPSLAPGKRD